MAAYAVALLVLLAISAPWLAIPIDNADSAGMQAHLHAIFEARDLLYDDEYAALGMSPLFAFVTERGVVSNHWPAGASFVQAPGWLLGRLAGRALVGGGISERAATWALPLMGVRCLAIAALAWLIVRVYRWLCARVPGPSATLASAALLLGTPIAYYAAQSPMRPHLWGAAVVAVLTMRWFDAVEHAGEDPERARADWRRPLELAAYAGLAAAIRPQLCLLALLVAHERWVASAEQNLGARIRQLARHGLAAAAVFAIWPLVVLRMQVWMYGGLGGYGGEVSHHLRAFLLSTHHGALIWCPVLLVGLLGVAIGLAARARGALVIAVLIAAQIWLDAGTREIEPYTVLGTRTWTGGTSFGPRKLLDAMPLLLPGVIWLQRWLDDQELEVRASWRRRLAGATILALVPTVLLLAAAFVDPSVCSAILDEERLAVALTLGLDPSNWAGALASRALPLRVSLGIGAIVGLPVGLLILAELRRGVASTTRPARVRRVWPWVLVIGYGVLANLWLLQLERRSADLLAADPHRMPAAAARLDPWHEAAVAQIPGHHRRLRARLGPGVTPE